LKRRDLPRVSLEDALKLVHLYAEKKSPKFERATSLRTSVLRRMLLTLHAQAR
jgi:hypothetical protein